MIMTLVDPGTYRKLTGDTTSTDGDITAALADAQDLAEQETRRHLESAQRTEQVRVDRHGRAYPRATPITAVTSDGWTISPDAGYLTGDRISSFDVITGTSDRVEITYTGGYTATTVPQRLIRALVALAYDQLNPADQQTARATSVRVGDVAVTYDRSAQRPDGLPDAPLRILRAFGRRL